MSDEFKRTCPNCFTEIVYNNYKSHYSAKTRNSICKSCRTRKANKSTKRYNKRDRNANWKGYKEIPYNWFSKYFERAGRKRNINGDITIEQVYILWLKQNKSCALSGLPIGWYDDNGKHTASIDRIDSNGEYTIDNIQLVHKDVNKMKNNLEESYFINLCTFISNHS